MNFNPPKKLRVGVGSRRHFVSHGHRKRLQVRSRIFYPSMTPVPTRDGGFRRTGPLKDAGIGCEVMAQSEDYYVAMGLPTQPMNRELLYLVGTGRS